MRIATVKKKPNEKFAVGFKYATTDLAGNATIATVEVSVSPNDDGANNLSIVGTPAKDDYSVSAVIQKGVDGKEYYVTFKTTTSVGYVFEDKIFVKVRGV